MIPPFYQHFGSLNPILFRLRLNHLSASTGTKNPVTTSPYVNGDPPVAQRTTQREAHCFMMFLKVGFKTYMDNIGYIIVHMMCL